ncbi:MAG: NADH-quinone oxidoreductase subunit N [Candidatus Micrarchaeaceae archaeon]
MIHIALILMALAAFLAGGNIIARLTNRVKPHFAFNSAMLLIITLIAGYMLLEGANVTVLGLVSINPFSLFFVFMLTLAMFMVNVIAYEYAGRFGDFAVMASFSMLGIYAVAFANSLITVFLGLELVVVPTVFIILLSRRSLEAATKLFIMSALSIALLSFAFVTIYGSTNTFSLESTQQSGLLLFAAVLFIASIGFEASIFPFNVLIPDVYEGSPSYATAMLGGINKKAGFIVLIQLMILVFVSAKSAFIIIAVLSVLTMLYGNIVAIMQRSFKRMLAYSSISQAGYMMIGIAAATSAGIAGTLFQIFAHAFIFIGIFAIVAWLESRNRKEIDDLIGLNQENRLMAAGATLFMLSLIGLPFTTGFVGKFLIFLSAVNSGLLWLAVIGIINTVISIYYYARPIMAMYTSKLDSEPVKPPLSVLFVVVACIAITLAIGIYPQAVIQMAAGASSYLFQVKAG